MRNNTLKIHVFNTLLVNNFVKENDMENFADLYSDYLICSTSYTTTTNIAALFNIKHDKITKELTKRDYDSKFLWQREKPYVQELTRAKDIITLSLDDSIEEKLYTNESELNYWHYDHTFGRSIKGVNFTSVNLALQKMNFLEKCYGSVMVKFILNMFYLTVGIHRLRI